MHQQFFFFFFLSGCCFHGNMGGGSVLVSVHACYLSSYLLTCRISLKSFPYLLSSAETQPRRQQASTCTSESKLTSPQCSLGVGPLTAVKAVGGSIVSLSPALFHTFPCCQRQQQLRSDDLFGSEAGRPSSCRFLDFIESSPHHHAMHPQTFTLCRKPLVTI